MLRFPDSSRLFGYRAGLAKKTSMRRGTCCEVSQVQAPLVPRITGRFAVCPTSLCDVWRPLEREVRIAGLLVRLLTK